MRKALLRIQVADQFAAAALVDRAGGKLDPGGVEVGGDIGHGRLLPDHKDLRTGKRTSAGQTCGQQHPQTEGRPLR